MTNEKPAKIYTDGEHVYLRVGDKSVRVENGLYNKFECELGITLGIVTVVLIVNVEIGTVYDLPEEFGYNIKDGVATIFRKDQEDLCECEIPGLVDVQECIKDCVYPNRRKEESQQKESEDFDKLAKKYIENMGYGSSMSDHIVAAYVAGCEATAKKFEQKESEEELRKKIGEILRDGIVFSPQVDGWVAVGAIDRLVKLIQTRKP